MASLAALSRRHQVAVLLGVALVALCVTSAVFGSWGWFHLCRLADEQAQMEALVVRLERQNERWEEHLRRLETDDVYLEKVVRERIGWVKPNEMLYRSGAPGLGEGGAAGAGEDFPARGG